MKEATGTQTFKRGDKVLCDFGEDAGNGIEMVVTVVYGNGLLSVANPDVPTSWTETWINIENVRHI